MKNQVQLITYVDRFGQGTIADLHQFLKQKLYSAIKAVHLLPFYNPIDGADAGYDPVNHAEVDHRLGEWKDVQKMSKDFELVADLIVNHISDKSEEYVDVSNNGRSSAYFDLFLTKDKVFSEGATEDDLNLIYRPRPHRPFSLRKLESGESMEFWTTFSRYQIDIDVHSNAGQAYIKSLMDKFSNNGVSLIRLDAVGYCVKKAGTSCFMLPETYDYISELADLAHSREMEVLAEVHSHYEIQLEIAKRVDYVYDFALPPLVLYTLFSKKANRLKQWYAISPRNCVTMLDTHDGIGVIDVAAYDNKPGILSNEEIDQLVETIHQNSKGSSRKSTGVAASNLDLYQVNCSYFDALGQDENLMLIARAIQFFSPGIPQVYYGGLLVATNDMSLLEETKVGRDINRPYFDFEAINTRLESSVVKALLRIIEIRNTHPSFNGNFDFSETTDNLLILSWKQADHWAILKVDLAEMKAKIEYSMVHSENGTFKRFILES